MKTNFIWATDTHLDFLDDDEKVASWIEQNLASKEGEAVLLTGDISLGPHVVRHLRMIKAGTNKKVFFVLGNHDYWDTSFAQLRLDIVHPDLVNDGIVWLGGADYVPFGESIAVVGHDGWYDALNGNAKKSRLMMNDWFRIEEFKNLKELILTCRKLAAEGVAHIEQSCTKAIADGRKKIILMTHFPPFVEACFYMGQRTKDDALPWYSSRLMGEALIALSEKNPEITFTVLCGHTHSFVDISPRPNLRVIVGNSSYGSPDSIMLGVSE